jgi:hypothetical protein
MADIKHVGRIKSTGRKCVVVFRTLPGDAFNGLVVQTESLPESYHDALLNLVEGNAAQTTAELSEVLARSIFPDGSTMLPSLHVKGLLMKVPTDQIEMTPNSGTSILLSNLNQIIAEQRGVSVQDLALKPDSKDTTVQEIASAKDISPPQGNTDPVIDQKAATTAKIEESLEPDALAKKYRSDADRLSKEAAQLRRMAEELVPTKKKVVTVE